MNKMRLAGILVAVCLGRGYADVTPAPADSDVFMTLTKTPVPVQSLPTTAEIVRPEEFKTWSAQTAGDVVARLTSIQVQPIGGLGSVQTVKVRGSTTNENLVLIDGRPIGGVAFGSSQDLTEIPVEEIDHIEIVRGGVSALYGPNAISGVINIITKRAVTNDQPVISAGYEGGSYGRNIFRGSVGAKNGPVDAFFYGNRQGGRRFPHQQRRRQFKCRRQCGLLVRQGWKTLCGWIRISVGNRHSGATLSGYSHEPI